MYPFDPYVFFSAASIPDLESQINSDLKYIDRWLKANKLSLNVAKTKFMVVSLRQKLQSLNDYTMNIHIDGVPINRPTLNQHIYRESVDSRSTLGRHLVDSWSIVGGW